MGGSSKRCHHVRLVQASLPNRFTHQEWIDRRWRWLTDEFCGDLMIDAPTVLPTEEFFPDPYDRSDDSVRTLVECVCGYMHVRAPGLTLR